MNEKTKNNLLKLVQDNYCQIAEHYSETRKKKLWPELIKLTADVEAGDRVLDAGCGSGKLLQAFEHKEIEYLGVDSCRELLEFARKDWAGHDSWQFKQGDVLALDQLGADKFDWVFCIAVLQHIPSRELRVKAMRQLKGQLKPGGKLVISVWNMWSASWQKKGFRSLIFKTYFFNLFNRDKMDFGDVVFDWKRIDGEGVSQRYYHAFTERELRSLASVAGLRVERVFKDGFNFYGVFTPSPTLSPSQGKGLIYKE